jgi:hypothetical protein
MREEPPIGWPMTLLAGGTASSARPRRSTIYGSWFGTFIKATLLGMEAQQVIALRTLRLMGGGALAQREMTRMLMEKGTAATAASFDAATAALRGRDAMSVSRKTIRSYRTRIRKNRRRLSR